MKILLIAIPLKRHFKAKMSITCYSNNVKILPTAIVEALTI